MRPTSNHKLRRLAAGSMVASLAMLGVVSGAGAVTPNDGGDGDPPAEIVPKPPVPGLGGLPSPPLPGGGA
jgi:hypothetical protein